MNGQCIAVVSGKGGTGKTSLVSSVGAALALAGRRVLCLDCDVGLRNLDLALGLADKALMDFSDVAFWHRPGSTTTTACWTPRRVWERASGWRPAARTGALWSPRRTPPPCGTPSTQ